MRHSVVLALVVALAVGAGVAQADDVTDAIAEAGSAYGSNDLKEARRQLQIASVGVNQRIIDKLISYFPDPPAGWTAEEPEGMDASAMGIGFFMGLTASRDYTSPSGTSIDVSVAGNSPLIASMRMFIANPMLAAMSGQTGIKSIKVCGYDAMEEIDSESDTCELNILAGNAMLISISGEGASDKDYVHTLANAIDCKGIVAAVE